MKRTAFTLIELLVVLVILGILVAILLPVFARPHRGQASRENCQSNLKQMASGAIMYFQDYDEVLPPSCLANPAAPDPGGHVAAITWDELLMPYVKNADVFRCPRDPLPQDLPARSYAANAWVMGTGYCHPGYLHGAPRYAVAYEKVREPAYTVLLAERWDKDERRVLGRADYHITWGSRACNNADHVGRANYAFVDGHVMSVNFERFQRKFGPGYRWRP